MHSHAFHIHSTPLPYLLIQNLLFARLLQFAQIYLFLNRITEILVHCKCHLDLCHFPKYNPEPPSAVFEVPPAIQKVWN